MTIRTLAGVAVLDRQVTPRIRVRSWRNDGASRRFAPGAHAEVEIAWVDEGGLDQRIGRRIHEVIAGRAFVVPAHVEHATTFGSGLRAGSVWVDRDTITEIASAIGAPPMASCTTVPAADIARVGRMLREEAQNDGPGQTVAVEALAEVLVVTLLRAQPARAGLAPCARDARIAAAVERVRDAYGEPLSVDDLAASAGLSRFHFSRLFREQVGTSPYRFIVRTRTERAAELLRTGRYGVTEAAFAVGFLDLGRFGRAFRARFGCAPRDLLPRPATVLSLRPPPR
jgi:AraC family transcriptional regulator